MNEIITRARFRKWKKKRKKVYTRISIYFINFNQKTRIKMFHLYTFIYKIIKKKNTFTLHQPITTYPICSNFNSQSIIWTRLFVKRSIPSRFFRYFIKRALNEYELWNMNWKKYFPIKVCRNIVHDARYRYNKYFVYTSLIRLILINYIYNAYNIRIYYT